MSEPSKKLVEARNRVSKVKPQLPKDNPLGAATVMLLNEQSEKLHELVSTVQTRLDAVFESQKVIIGNQELMINILQRIAEPKKWKFNIQRHNVDGHILSVEAVCETTNQGD